MAVLTANRPTPQYGGVPDSPMPQRYYLPVAANVNIYQGALVVVDSSGNANPAGAGSGSPVVGCVVGRADDQGDNLTAITGGLAGAISIEVRNGVFLWDIAGTITKATFGIKVYAVDDHTVQTTAASLSAAGYCLGVDPTTGYAIVWTCLGAFGIQV